MKHFVEQNTWRLIRLHRQFKKTSIFLATLFVILLIYLLFFSASQDLAQDMKVVEIENVQLKNIQETAQFIGIIQAEKQTLLIAKSRGILDRHVTSGQTVQAGELIASIVNNEVKKNYELSQNMEKIAKVQHERLNQLLKSGALSKNAAEEKESQWMESQKKLADARRAFEDINIYAPFDGIVGIFKVREGAEVQEGESIVTFYDPSTTIVEFNVPLSIASMVQDGAPVFINNQAYTLTHIQKMLDESSHMSPAYVNIVCTKCIIGATADVRLVVKQKKSVVVIPYESVFLRTGRPHVYIVREDSVVLTPVKLGVREQDMTEVTSGLKKGDRVVIRGQARLYPGAVVKIARDHNR